MIPLLAFAATIELQCADVDKFMDNVESVRIVHMTKNQKKEVREALVSFATDKCPIISLPSQFHPYAMTLSSPPSILIFLLPSR